MEFYQICLISSKILSHPKKKKKKLVYCNVFGMVSPLVFGINVFFKEKKKINWTHGAKLNNN